jgi:hypothetical protein
VAPTIELVRANRPATCGRTVALVTSAAVVTTTSGGLGLAWLRRLCLELPEAIERSSHGEPTWFVGGKGTDLHRSSRALSANCQQWQALSCLTRCRTNTDAGQAPIEEVNSMMIGTARTAAVRCRCGRRREKSHRADREPAWTRKAPLK